MGGIDTGKEIIAALIEHRCVNNRAGGDAANNIAFYQAFGLFRIFQLLADRNFITFLHQFVTHRIIFGCISRPIAWFDRHVVDGFMNLLARTTQSAALGIRFMQSGSVQRYCIWFFAGTLGLTLLLLILR